MQSTRRVGTLFIASIILAGCTALLGDFEVSDGPVGVGPDGSLCPPGEVEKNGRCEPACASLSCGAHGRCEVGPTGAPYIVGVFAQPPKFGGPRCRQDCFDASDLVFHVDVGHACIEPA